MDPASLRELFFYHQKAKGTLAMIAQPTTKLRSWLAIFPKLSSRGGLGKGQGRSWARLLGRF